MTLATLRPFLFYAASIALGKGLSLITLPVMARALDPAQFVRLDMAASLVEPVGLFAAFALGDTLFRHARGTPEDLRVALGRLLGLGLAVASLLVLLTQFALLPLVQAWPNMPGETALRLVLLAACLGGMIELPLAYMRLGGHAGLFLTVVAARSLMQAGLMVGLLLSGWGIDAVLIANASVDIAIVAVLLLTLPKGTRPALALGHFRPLLRYAGPILLGGFAMFALGACDRWFLAGKVAAQDLAHYALAAKLALALALLTQPFALWWYPRRLGVLAGPDGIARTMRFWMIGLALVGLGAVLVMLGARLLILGFMPEAYHGALRYLPALLAIAALNELSSLSNGVAYARADGWRVLTTNLSGASVALLFYLLLIPPFGVTGAIVATLLGQVVRLGLFLADRHGEARLPYPLLRAGLFASVCIGLVGSLGWGAA
ncbi:MAG: oligosaccharide flippase family protein [Beijerinckiaceae bacterium]|nr:oligosaccharide flippase family protein [Beijerinckiaceae bacterium]